MNKLIDLTQPIASDMPVYPGDARTELVQTRFLAQDYHNNYQLTTSMHTGTHVDGPMHLLDGDRHIAEGALNSFIGEGCLLDVRGQAEIKLKSEYLNLVPENSIVLLYSGHSQLYGREEYYQKHPLVSQDLCQFLISRKIKLLGLDWPSPDNYPFAVHKALLERGIFIIENLTNLERLANRRFEVIAMPLRLKADSSPVRAVARIFPG